MNTNSVISKVNQPISSLLGLINPLQEYLSSSDSSRSSRGENCSIVKLLEIHGYDRLVWAGKSKVEKQSVVVTFLVYELYVAYM